MKLATLFVDTESEETNGTIVNEAFCRLPVVESFFGFQIYLDNGSSVKKALSPFLWRCKATRDGPGFINK